MQRVFIFILMFFLTGCATLTSKNKNEIVEFDNMLSKNSCSYIFVDKKLENGNDVILWAIQGGIQARNCGDFNKSISLFDTAEYLYKYDVDFKNLIIQAGHTAKSIFLNNNANPYEGNIYEKIMVNTYKGLSFLALGDKDSARVEFNRALERQIIAKEYFAKEIDSQINKKNSDLQEMSNSQKSFNSYAANKARKEGKNSHTTLYFNDRVLEQVMDYAQNENAIFYPDFVNPFTTYISGLFSLLDGNIERASYLFREGLQMDSPNVQIKKDFILTEHIAQHGEFSEKYIWVIYESGLGAILEETRIDLPLFLVSSSYSYTGIALPRVKLRENSYEYLKIKNSSGDEAFTYFIASMDNIIEAEFKKRYATIATQAVISAAIKTISQKYLNEQDSLLGIFATFYQILSTRADLRNWSSLPKYFLAGRIPIKDGNIEIYTQSGQLLYAKAVSEKNNIIIYIKSSHMNQVLIHEIYF